MNDAAYYRAWRKSHPEYRKREAARVAQYWRDHPQKKREQWRAFYATHWQERRVAERVRKAVKTAESGRLYSPRYYNRKPEYLPPYVQAADARSAFLVANLSPEQVACARELAIERKAWRER